MSEMEVWISYAQPLLLPAILSALGRIAGVALLGSDVKDEVTRSPSQEGLGKVKSRGDRPPQSWPLGGSGR